MSASSPGLTVATTLLASLPGAARAARIAALLADIPASARVSVILEGVAPGEPAEVAAGAARSVHTLAPGCPCCIGNLTLRVTLTRVLRHEQPQYLIIAIADTTHLASLRTLLQGPPWNQWLAL